jgi:hypothetical protein
VRCSPPLDLFTASSDATPLEPVLSGAVDLVAGAQHSCALLEDRTVQCWGDNRMGALGYHTDGAAPLYTPTGVPGLHDVVALAARDAFYQFDWTCALREGGEVACWGSHLSGVTVITELQGARAIRVGDHDVFALMGDRQVLMYTSGVAVRRFELARPVRDFEAGWHGFCAGDGSSLECIDLVYQDALTPMRVARPYRTLAHTWDRPLLIDDAGKAHHAEPRNPGAWQPVPELDGASGLVTNSMLGSEGCGLFPDGRIACVDSL